MKQTNNLATWSINNPAPVIVLFFILTVLGIYGFYKINIQDFPDIDMPTVSVSVNYPSASSGSIETEITKKIEDAVASLDKIDTISSSIKTGSSSTTIVFDLDKNSSDALNEVRDAVSKIRSSLPTDLPNDPIVSKSTAAGVISTYSLSVPNKTESEISWITDNIIAKKITSIKGVGSFSRLGGVNRIVKVKINPQAMAFYDITPLSISNQIKAVQNEFPSGNFNIGNNSQTIKVLYKAQDINDLKNMTINLGGNKTAILSSIADIEDTISTRNQAAFLNDKNVVSFQINRAVGYGEKEVDLSIKKAITQLKEQIPNSEINLISSTIPRVDRSYKGSLFALIEGSILACVVVFLFLKSWRATLVSSVALPLSIIPTFAFIYYMGFSLNTLTLLAITLVIGVLVDDAIVEVENIERHAKTGKFKSILDATKAAVTEIGLAVVATSFTLIAVFLPTAFMGGVPGKFFKQFGWTAAIAVFVSLLVARLLTPILAVWFLKINVSEHKQEHQSHLFNYYINLVKKLLQHPLKTISAAFLFFIFSIFLISQIPSTFIPAEDRGQISLSVTLPPATSYNKSLSMANMIRQKTSNIKEVVDIYTAIGNGAVSSGGPPRETSSKSVNNISFLYILKDYSLRSRNQFQIEKDIQEILNQIPGISFSTGVGASGEKLTISLASNNQNILNKTSAKIINEVRKLSAFGNIYSSASLVSPEIIVEPNLQKIAETGASPSSIAQVIKAATVGVDDVLTPKFYLDERQIPIKVTLPEEYAYDIENLLNLKVPSGKNLISLSEVANVYFSDSQSSISRTDRNRVINISISLNSMPIGKAQQLIKEAGIYEQLPKEVQIVPSGDLKRMSELFSSFALAMAAGCICIILVLILLFKNISSPFTIIMALPLSLGGAFGALYITGNNFSMPVLIGLLMLMGVVTKNSILLVDYIILARTKYKLSNFDSIIDACSKRARPIIMTTIAMIAGMLPMALSNTDAFKAPMAITVIGGLLTSTILSLLIIPCVFLLTDKIKDKINK